MIDVRKDGERGREERKMLKEGKREEREKRREKKLK